ncbi:MAG: LytTR family DNA-binding domain-containing protein [Saprospiraceae bacterium]|nr:LytTR family DNA-binding domain-containing protein [Saprospiraceae bacterium]
MNILVIEDEQLAGEKLKSYIRDFVGKDVVVTWLRSISEVVEYLKSSQKIDIIFSDIELLDGNVFSIFDSVKIKCPIIFCTAYDQFILKAFKVNGIAYLLKPYDEFQFKEAWSKYQLLFEKKEALSISDSLLSELKLLVEDKSTAYKTRFTIKKANGLFLLSIYDIIFFQSQGDFIVAMDKEGKKHIINSSIHKLMETLNPKQFFQINRSEIINIDWIEKIETHFKNKMLISMLGTKEKLYTSASRTPDFRNWLE